MELTAEVIALLMGVAFVAGVIDALAGGGGLLTIPALMAAGVPPVAAIATNKLQSSFGTASAVYGFARQGRIDFRRFLKPAAGAFLGSMLGAWTLQRVDPGFLRGLIPGLLLLMVVYFLVAPKASEEDRHSRLGPAALVGVIAAIGFYDGFFGPGTGSFFSTSLVALRGYGLTKATALTKLFNVTSNVASVIFFAIGGKMFWLLGLCMAAGAMLGGWIGSHTAMRFGARLIRPLLVTLSLGLTVRLLWSYFGA